MTGKSVSEILLEALIEQLREVKRLQRKVKDLTAKQSELDQAYESFNAIVLALLICDLSQVTIRRDLKKGHEGLLIVIVIGSKVSFRFPAKFLVGNIKEKVEKKMESKISIVRQGTTFKGLDGETKLVVYEKGFPYSQSIHDAKVRWTSDLRRKALSKLQSMRPDLYERFRLASLASYRDDQIYCTRITGESYCEVREGHGSNMVLAIFGGNTGGDYNHSSPIPNVPGGEVQWYKHLMRSGWYSTGYETICRIVKPSNWQGDETEIKNWINFVENNIDKVANQIKWDEDPQKQYFSIRHIPDMSHCRSKLGYSPLEYN